MLDRRNVTNSIILSKLDLKSAYHQVRIRSGDEWKTAFTTPFGQFEYNVLPYGLSGAPATFQRLMDGIFADMYYVNVVVYLDDILVFSESKEKHAEHLKEVCRRLMAYGLTVNPKKCEFEKTSLDFL